MDRSRMSFVVMTLILASACRPNVDTTDESRAGAVPEVEPGPDIEVLDADEVTVIEGVGVEAAAGGANDDWDIAETAAEFMARYEAADLDDAALIPAAVGKFIACIECHGENGNGDFALDTPQIGGMEAWYLARQLKYFKAGLRGMTDEDVQGTHMRAVALLIDTEREAEDLARYFASMSPPPMPPTIDGDIAHGEELYAVCTACHGPDARGSAELNTPSMIGQNGEYLVRQLEYFRTGLRGTHPADIFGQQMVPIAMSALTSRNDSRDVVAYIESLGPAAEGRGTETSRNIRN